MSARALVIGLDGADVDVIAALGPARLPELHRLMARGAWARLESVKPFATLPNWTTFLTGVDPGRHGVFDFTTRRGYRVAFTAGTVREAPTVAARLDAMGLACACVGFPATWPPEPLERGVFVSGWDSPVAFEADRSFVWPSSLHDEILRRFGPLRFDDVDEFDADSPGWRARLPGALVDRVRAKTELASWLLDRRDWDLFAFYFGESDTAAHHLWASWDEASPRHPPKASREERRGPAARLRGARRGRGRAGRARRRGGRGHHRQRSRLGRLGRQGALPEPRARGGGPLCAARGQPARAARGARQGRRAGRARRARAAAPLLGRGARAARARRVARALRGPRPREDARLQRGAELLPLGVLQRARPRARGDGGSRRRPRARARGGGGAARAARSVDGRVRGRRGVAARGALRGPPTSIARRTSCSSSASIAATA
ncbi:MAG: alkaline phosphatase family protein [Sandaracinaceae bacterium]|nr:alkaline phosphatase family protein [Sandaracinaceae bacterium]